MKKLSRTKNLKRTESLSASTTVEKCPIYMEKHQAKQNIILLHVLLDKNSLQPENPLSRERANHKDEEIRLTGPWMEEPEVTATRPDSCLKENSYSGDLPF